MHFADASADDADEFVEVTPDLGMNRSFHFLESLLSHHFRHVLSCVVPSNLLLGVL
jgi:hypothetical protein